MPRPQTQFQPSSEDESLFQQIPLTLGLIVFMVGIYIILAWMGKSIIAINVGILRSIGQNNNRIFDQNAYYLLISSIFVHANLVHLGYNMIWLLAFGHKVEETLSELHYLISFIFTGLVGNLLSLLWGRDFLSVGASGAVFGLLGILLAQQRSQNPKTWRKTLYLTFFLFILTISINTNILAHLGGLLAGFVWGTKIESTK